MFLVIGFGLYYTTDLISHEVALEYYHLAFWFKCLILPFAMITKKERERVKEAAKRRARELKEKAYRERAMIAPPDEDSKPETLTEVGALLRSAANNLGKKNFDVSQFEESLEEDWYSSVDQLRGLSVNTLDQYMPRALAQEVFDQLIRDDKGVDILDDAAWEKK